MECLQNFNTASDLFSWLIEPKNRMYYFRGISSKEQVYPSIMRTKDKDLSFAENKILNDFIRFGSSLIGNINNAFDCVAYAQHFGLPTRLVDWSRNPLIALFFSLYYSKQSQSEPKILLLPNHNTMPISEPLYLQTWGSLQLNDENPVRSYIKFIDQVKNGKFADICIASILYHENIEGEAAELCSNKIKESDKKKFMIMVNSGYSNPRILAQDGLFYFPRKLNRSDIDDEYVSSGVKYISVPVEWKSTLLNMLDLVGVSKYKLFFDLQNICSFIVEQIEDYDNNFLVNP